MEEPIVKKEAGESQRPKEEMIARSSHLPPGELLADKWQQGKACEPQMFEVVADKIRPQSGQIYERREQ